MTEYWQTTANLFGGLIERPKMTEKLLTKPPFRYIFDIVQETTKVTSQIQYQCEFSPLE
jgi:TRAF3-interacting protein 1